MSSRKPPDYHVVEPGQAHPLGWKVPDVNDLRSAVAYLKQFPGEYLETDREVDPKAELAGVYRRVGAGALSCVRPGSGQP